MVSLTIFSAFSGIAEGWNNFWGDMDYNAFWGWVLVILGVICLFLLIFFTEYKRPERDSVKFSAITVVIASILIGFGLNMVLIAGGLW